MKRTVGVKEENMSWRKIEKEEEQENKEEENDHDKKKFN